MLQGRGPAFSLGLSRLLTERVREAALAFIAEALGWPELGEKSNAARAVSAGTGLRIRGVGPSPLSSQALTLTFSRERDGSFVLSRVRLSSDRLTGSKYSNRWVSSRAAAAAASTFVTSRSASQMTTSRSIESSVCGRSSQGVHVVWLQSLQDVRGSCTGCGDGEQGLVEN